VATIWCTKLENCAVTVVQLPKVDPENFTFDKFRGGYNPHNPPLHTGLIASTGGGVRSQPSPSRYAPAFILSRYNLETDRTLFSMHAHRQPLPTTDSLQSTLHYAKLNGWEWHSIGLCSENIELVKINRLLLQTH